MYTYFFCSGLILSNEQTQARVCVCDASTIYSLTLRFSHIYIYIIYRIHKLLLNFLNEHSLLSHSASYNRAFVLNSLVKYIIALGKP